MSWLPFWVLETNQPSQTTMVSSNVKFSAQEVVAELCGVSDNRQQFSWSYTVFMLCRSQIIACIWDDSLLLQLSLWQYCDNTVARSTSVQNIRCQKLLYAKTGAAVSLLLSRRKVIRLVLTPLEPCFLRTVLSGLASSAKPGTNRQVIVA